MRHRRKDTLFPQNQLSSNFPFRVGLGADTDVPFSSQQVFSLDRSQRGPALQRALDRAFNGKGAFGVGTDDARAVKVAVCGWTTQAGKRKLPAKQQGILFLLYLINTTFCYIMTPSSPQPNTNRERRNDEKEC